MSMLDKIMLATVFGWTVGQMTSQGWMLWTLWRDSRKDKR
jgi:hypothetical protein